MCKIINMVNYKMVKKGYSQRILWDGLRIHSVIIKDCVAEDFDNAFEGQSIPNPIQYKVFLEKREALKTIVALEDLVEQYVQADVELPMVVEQINHLREKYNLYESKEKEN